MIETNRLHAVMKEVTEDSLGDVRVLLYILGRINAHNTVPALDCKEMASELKCSEENILNNLALLDVVEFIRRMDTHIIVNPHIIGMNSDNLKRWDSFYLQERAMKENGRIV